MSIDSDYIVIAVIIGLLLAVRAARVRWRRQRIARIDQATTDIQVKLAVPADATTPVCPICGKVDDRRPFIRHAIECHRADCGA